MYDIVGSFPRVERGNDVQEKGVGARRSGGVKT